MIIEFRIDPDCHERIWLKNGKEHRPLDSGPSSVYEESQNKYWYVNGRCIKKELKDEYADKS